MFIILNDLVKEKIVIIISSIGMFLSTLDTGIINVALPYLKNHFNVSTNTVALTVIGYSTSLAIFIMLFGFLSDTKGKLKIANIGMWLFMLASIFCGITNSIYLIVLFRIIQGIGAAALQATSASLITTLIHPSRQNNAIGTIGIMIGLGPVLGPSLGGLLLSLGSWRLIFLINVPFTLIGIFCIFILERKISEVHYNKQIDIVGFILVALLLSSFLIGLNCLSKVNIKNIGVLLIFVSFILSFVVYKFEIRKKFPILNMKIVTSKKVLILLLQTILFGFASAIVFLIPPFLFENILHVSVGITGLLVLGAPIGIALFSKISGRLNDGSKNNIYSLVGIFLMVISFILLSILSNKISYIFITIFLFIYGAGGGFFQPANVSNLMSSVGLSDQGSMSALQRMMQNIAIAVGSSIGSLIMYSFQGNELYGIRTSYFMTLFLMVIILFISCLTYKIWSENKKVSD